jgi:hypothetical protein
MYTLEGALSPFNFLGCCFQMVRHVDCTIDPQNKKALKIIVRSWDPVMNMDRLGSPEGEGQEGFPASSQSPAFLLPRMQSTLWEISIGFEVEQGCTLAAHHIETMRQRNYKERLARFQDLLQQLLVEDTFEIEPEASGQGSGRGHDAK